MISVIVPIFQVEAYLERCVNSILSQDERDIEVILVDDGSPDRCGEICDRFAALDSRVKVIHQENCGLSGARNAGLDACRGQYVCFVDGDDDIDPQMLSSLIDAIQFGKYDLAICGYRRFQGEETVSPLRLHNHMRKPLTLEELWQEVFGRLNNAAWGKLYKRELAGDLRFPTGIVHGEDFVFTLNYITRCKNGILLDAPFYRYRIRPGSITRSGFREARFDEIITKDEALQIVKQHQPCQLINARKYCFRARMNVLRALYRSGLEKEYSEQVQACRKYVREHYAEVADVIRFRERAEYRLLQLGKPVYAWVTRLQRE